MDYLLDDGGLFSYSFDGVCLNCGNNYIQRMIGYNTWRRSCRTILEHENLIRKKKNNLGIFRQKRN